MKTPEKRCRAKLACALALMAAGLTALQAQPAAAPAAKDEEAVTLKEFNVTAKPISEYAAAESTTGTRVVSAIRDLPFNVNVVTGELIDDFMALEFRDQMAYTSNVTGYETLSSGYSIR